ncbi:MAG: 4-hydroxy-tetrahydrodipicolinate reductase [Betaproteobacteria bacterium]|nr:4-hydroxy-tetrahydrodipicolinate reductase [Betaproteobacteria bacterium]
MTVKVGVSGAAGRMGRRIISAVCRNKKTELAAALESSDSPMLGQDAAALAGESAAGIFITADFAAADVYIDFSVPAAVLELAKQCRKTKTALIVGATGFAAAEKKELHAAAADIALVVAPNMSAGVNVMFLLAKAAAKYLPNHDMEVFEAHHRGKKDAPSGTALRLGEIMAKAAGADFSAAAVFSRTGSDNCRKDGEIGFSVMRGGDIVGEHRAVFAGEGEQLEIIHRSTSRDNYAAGAVAAAIFAAAAAPGLYGMEDVLAAD